MNTRQAILFAVTFISIVIIGMFAAFKMETASREQHRFEYTDCIFYDGEGNPIPVEIVELYVKQHFVYLSEEDSIAVSEYFY